MSIESSREPDRFQRFEQEGWDSVISAYDRSFGRLTPQSSEALLDAARVDAGCRLLDDCCGPGMISAAAAARGAAVSALDFSTQALALAKSAGIDADFTEGDALNLPWPDDDFDAAVCGFGIMHLADPLRGVSEMARVTRPGGRIAISVWAPLAPDNGFGVAYEAIRRHADMQVDLPHGPDFFQFAENRRLDALLREAGLEQIKVSEAPQYWAFGDAGALFESLIEGTVRTRGLIRAQTPEIQQRIRSAIADRMSAFRVVHGAYRVPMPALIGAGTVPAGS